LEQTPVVLADAKEYREVMASVIFREHLAQVPDDELRAQFVASLTEQAVSDDPPFQICYRRLNLQGRRPLW
jgi:hypothetical protein